MCNKIHQYKEKERTFVVGTGRGGSQKQGSRTHRLVPFMWHLQSQHELRTTTDVRKRVGVEGDGPQRVMAGHPFGDGNAFHVVLTTTSELHAKHMRLLNLISISCTLIRGGASFSSPAQTCSRYRRSSIKTRGQCLCPHLSGTMKVEES